MARVNGCCCFSLKTGSLIIATLGWIGTLCKIFSFDAADKADNSTDMATSSLGYRIGSAIVSLIVCILLVVGIHKKSPNYFIPWLVISCLEAIALSIITVICFVFIFIGTHGSALAFGIAFAILLIMSGLTWYFWIVVYSHYQELKTGVVNVVSGTGGNVYYSPSSNYPPAYNKDSTQMA